MEKVDRRTFLATGLKLGATAVVAGAAVETVGAGAGAAAGADGGGSPRPVASGPHAPTMLTTNGVVGPVGVDPDDVHFAWHVVDAQRGAVQSAYRLMVTGPGESSATVWDSGRVAEAGQAFVPYGGSPLSADSRYRWTVATADGAGHFGAASRPSVFTTGLRGADWSAQWLRPGPADPGLEEYCYLRTTQRLPPGTIAYATAYLAGAHKFQLWVNGSQLDTGPSFCFSDEQYYQATDITAALVAGRSNVVGVLHHWYGPGQGRPASAPGLLAQVVVHYTDRRVVTIGSDGSWRTRRAEWMPAPQRNSDVGDFVEWIDGRQSPAGWSADGFDDRSWAPAVVLGPVGTEPFTRLFAQRTRITEHTVPAVSVRTLASGSVVVDFGKVYAGRPTVEFRGGTSGHTVPMHVGYTLDPDGSVSTTHNTQGTDLSYSYIQRAGTQTFDPFVYLGFRYLQIDDPGEPIHRDQVALAARHATMPELPVATFSSSEPTLDAVWELCAHSGLYTSQEQFIDTPTREKGQFVWDSANESQTVMRACGEQNLSGQGLRDMARAQARYWPTSGQVNEVYPNDDGAQNYPAFTALYPEWVWRYYLATGDAATVVDLLPVLSRLSDYLMGIVDPATGLVAGQPQSNNGDEQYGYDYDTNADTTLNILTVNAFRRIGAVAALANDGATATAQNQRATVLAAAVNAQLVSPTGLYVDGLRTDGTQSAHSSQLANVAALAYGVAPTDQVARLGRYVASLDISVQPDHGMELLRALHAAGLDADVVRILTDASFPGWAAILKAGGTFTWETWTPSDLIGDGMSHGWGSSALVAMQEGLLGAVPMAPSADGPPTLVAFTPPSGGLAHVSGSFPSPAGTYMASWDLTRARRQLSITVPPNAGAQCVFPGATLSEVTEGGTPAQHAPGVGVVPGAPDTLTLALGAGTYQFAVVAR
jgi:alpha-L-rhamnosidase